MENKVCPHCKVGLDPENPKTHYACGWPVKPLSYIDPIKFHSMGRKDERKEL